MILVLNCGSQSIKWKVYNEKLKLIKQGKRAVLVSEEFENILDDELNKITEEITIIGHRVVHGGKFTKPIKITSENLQELEKISHLAPLHNPYNILGIKTAQKIFANVPNIAVFDTEFFSNLPERAYTYALPEKFKFRRYGFHGTSHEYVARRACEILEEQAKKVHPVKYRKAVISAKPKLFDWARIITCHLGGGSSITAIKNGKAIDTSMGFTPQEGLVMMTRPGNIDAGIVLELAKEFGAEEANKILNKESGMKGICGESEFLKILSHLERDPAMAGEKNKYQLAFDIFIYSIKKYIGAYFAILGGCDILVFTGAIGAGNPKTRNNVCKGLDILNPSTGSGRGKTKIMVIETDEEMAIAQKIKNFKN